MKKDLLIDSLELDAPLKGYADIGNGIFLVAEGNSLIDLQDRMKRLYQEHVAHDDRRFFPELQQDEELEFLPVFDLKALFERYADVGLGDLSKRTCIGQSQLSLYKSGLKFAILSEAEKIKEALPALAMTPGQSLKASIRSRLFLRVSSQEIFEQD